MKVPVVPLAVILLFNVVTPEVVLYTTPLSVITELPSVVTSFPVTEAEMPLLPAAAVPVVIAATVGVVKLVSVP